MTEQHKIRVYRDGNGDVSIYIKAPSEKWLKVADALTRTKYDTQIFGFVSGVDYEEINDFIKKEFPFCKCINATRANGDYNAVHIYFKQDNMHYQWELQLWFKGDEEKNHLSHKKHKQEYTLWEKLFKNRKGGYDG